MGVEPVVFPIGGRERQHIGVGERQKDDKTTQDAPQKSLLVGIDFRLLLRSTVQGHAHGWLVSSAHRLRYLKRSIRKRDE